MAAVKLKATVGTTLFSSSLHHARLHYRIPLIKKKVIIYSLPWDYNGFEENSQVIKKTIDN